MLLLLPIELIFHVCSFIKYKTARKSLLSVNSFCCNIVLHHKDIFYLQKAIQATEETVTNFPLISCPFGLVLNSKKDIYVSYAVDHKVVRISPSGNKTTFVGSYNYGEADGQGENAFLAMPHGMAVDGNDNIFLCDSGNKCIRKIDLEGNVTSYYKSESWNKLEEPCGIAVDKTGNLYVTDTHLNKIVKITPNGSVEDITGADPRHFSCPSSICMDPNGNIYVANCLKHVISKISTDGTVSTFAGNGEEGRKDGKGSGASFSHPSGIDVDQKGNLYVTENSSASTIRKITPKGKVTTIHLKLDKELMMPQSVVTDPKGNYCLVVYPMNQVLKKFNFH